MISSKFLAVLLLCHTNTPPQNCTRGTAIMVAERKAENELACKTYPQPFAAQHDAFTPEAGVTYFMSRCERYKPLPHAHAEGGTDD